MILKADARHIPLQDESVQMCVTSPPYFAQRDYGVTGQIGLERTVAEYVSVILEVLREIRRVLKPSGVLFLNLGDCHYSSDRGGWRGDAHRWEKSELQRHNRGNATTVRPNRMPQDGLKDKDLIGIPWRVALAAQADGWWLRSDIIWSKTACMPESITDRPTRSHEYIFLLTKSGRYFYNADAIREPHTYNGGLGDHHRNVDLSGIWQPPGQKSPHNGLRKPRVKTSGPGPHPWWQETSTRTRTRRGTRIPSSRTEQAHSLDDQPSAVPGKPLRHLPRNDPAPVHPRGEQAGGCRSGPLRREWDYGEGCAGTRAQASPPGPDVSRTGAETNKRDASDAGVDAMIYLYLYIRPEDLPRYEADGWEYIGKMHPDNWASPNHDSIIVRRPVESDAVPAQEVHSIQKQEECL